MFLLKSSIHFEFIVIHGVRECSDFILLCVQFSSVQSLSCVWLFATPWIAAHQASLSITNSQSSPKLMCSKSVMPSSHLILCCPLLLLPPIPPSIRSFQMSQLFASGDQSIGVSALALVLPMNIQDWSPLGWTCWMFQHQGLFQWVNSLHERAKVLEFQLQHKSFQWTTRTDLL